jgi:hypothetical protein
MMANFKLSEYIPLEGDRQSEILMYLAVEPMVKMYIRINGGGVKRNQGWVWFYRLFMGGRKLEGKGVVDIIGLLRDGRFLALEVKRPDKEPTPEQLEFLALVRDTNGIAGIVENWQQVRSLIHVER